MIDDETKLFRRLELVRGTISRQKEYIARVPDPDNRSQAEANLMTLVSLRQDLEDRLGAEEPRPV